jgi:hypothetical protein
MFNLPFRILFAQTPTSSPVVVLRHVPYEDAGPSNAKSLRPGKEEKETAKRSLRHSRSQSRATANIGGVRDLNIRWLRPFSVLVR